MKHDLKALRDLEKRLAEAKGPDRVLDFWIAVELGPNPLKSDTGTEARSLDAAVALVERVLPGSGWLIGRGRLKPTEPLYGATVHATDLTDMADEPEEIGGGEGPSPALALCLACVRALIAQGEVAP